MYVRLTITHLHETITTALMIIDFNETGGQTTLGVSKEHSQIAEKQTVGINATSSQPLLEKT